MIRIGHDHYELTRNGQYKIAWKLTPSAKEILDKYDIANYLRRILGSSEVNNKSMTRKLVLDKSAYATLMKLCIDSGLSVSQFLNNAIEKYGSDHGWKI